MKRFICCFKQKGQRSNPHEDDNRNPPGVSIGTQEAGPSTPAPSHQTPVETRNPDPLGLGGATFTYAEIVAATGNLQTSNIVGQGGFGEVYRGHIDRLGRDVAAKILSRVGRQGDTEFISEVRLLQRADHPNVIKILGHCASGLHRVIVYEFMPLGSVDQHLFGTQQRPLKWETRMKIAIGTARGLEYVHKRMKVIHRDVKIENILLDNEFEPKITDFGLAKEAQTVEEADVRPPRVTEVFGTPGCIAPEYEAEGLLSFGCDSYSYGVFLIQLLTGRKAYESGRPQEKRNLVDWIRPLWNKDANLRLLADPKLGHRYSMEGLRQAFTAARLCVHPHATARPNMIMVRSLLTEAARFPVDPPVSENTTEEKRHSMHPPAAKGKNKAESSGTGTC